MDDIIKNLKHERNIENIEFDKTIIELPDKIIDKIEEYHSTYSENDPDVETLLHDWGKGKQKKYAYVKKLYEDQHGQDQHGKKILAGLIFLSFKQSLGYTSTYSGYTISRNKARIEHSIGGDPKLTVDFKVSDFLLGRGVPEYRIWGEAGHRISSDYFEDRVKNILDRVTLNPKDIFIHIPKEFESENKIQVWTIDSCELSMETNIQKALSKDLDKIPDDV